MIKVSVFDPTNTDQQSAVRGVGRYLQILKDTFPNWHYLNKPEEKGEVFINPFFNLLQPPLTLRRLAKKQIAVIHDLIPLKYPDKFPAGLRGKINIFLNKLALKKYDLIVADSYDSKNNIVKILKIPENKIKVIYPCLPKIFSNPKCQIPNSKQISTSFNQFQPVPTNFCLYVGDATWNKNLSNLAKAIKIANITGVFVGKVFEKKDSELTHPWQQELKQFLTEVRNDQRFILLGFVDDYRLFKLYQQARFNILISQDEGFGFSYLEAGYFSCPSLLSQIPVLKEISNKQGSLFADHNNPNDIADKMIKLYYDDKLRNKLGFEAQQRTKFFSQKKFKDSFLKVIL